MKHYFSVFFVLSALVTGCGTHSEAELNFNPERTHENATELQSRPFGKGGDSRISFSRYIDALYQDNIARHASPSEVAAATSAYRSGASLPEVVRGITSRPEFAKAVAALKEIDETRGRSRTVSGAGRGFSTTDFLLLYLAFSDNYKPKYDYSQSYSNPSQPTYNFNQYYPSFYASRPYIYDYLLYYYLLR